VTTKQRVKLAEDTKKVTIAVEVAFGVPTLGVKIFVFDAERKKDPVRLYMCEKARECETRNVTV
jgi:translation elongation factor EF-1beta